MPDFSRFILLTVCLLFFTFPAEPAAAQSPAQRAAERLPLEPCTLEGVDEELLCGTLKVPENRTEEAGRRISINVVVVPSLAEHPEPAPFVNLPGGPGVASTMAAEEFVRWMPQFRRHRDVLLVDQRGTGGSHPLHCEMTTDSPNPHGFLNEMYPVEAVEQCRTELERIADLRFYTTEMAARDLEDVRKWLGYEQLNLFGTSYGSRLALVYMRHFPDRVRSATLFGPTLTYLYMPSHHARDGHRAMDLLLADCEQDAACSTAYPAIRDEWTGLLNRLEREPARVQYRRPASEEAVSFVIERDIFAEVIRSRLYAPITMRRIPHVVHRAYKGDFSPFIDFARLEWEPKPPFLAEGMYLAVTCSEDLPFIDLEEMASINRDRYFGNYRVEQQARACEMWPAGAVPEQHHEPVRADVPVLILTGEFDPVTPPHWGDEVARHLPNSRHVTIPAMAHAPAGLSNIDCLIDLMADFVSEADTENLDATCVHEMLPIPFYIPGSDTGNGRE